MIALKKFFIVSCIFTSFFTISQTITEQCATDIIHQQKMANDSVYRQSIIKAEEIIQAGITHAHSVRFGVNDTIIIPVVVHVLHLGEAVGTGTNISDAQINSSIDNLNHVFSNGNGNSEDLKIKFALAVRDPNCLATNGINRIDASGIPGYAADGVSDGGAGADEDVLKDLSKWPTDQYLNFWIVTEIAGNNGGFGIQGWASLPFNWVNPYAGSVMMYSVFGYDPANTNGWGVGGAGLNSGGENGTVIHEVGHFLGLYHTFQGDGGGGACPGDATVGTDSDGCADTDPHRRNASVCPANGTANLCVGGGVMDEVKLNYMDYSSCASLKFTSDQKDRMRSTMLNIIGRKELVTSSKGLVPPPPFVPNTKVAPSTPITSNLTGNFGGIGDISIGYVSNTSTFSSKWDNDNFGGSGYLDFAQECGMVLETTIGESIDLVIEPVSTNSQGAKVWVDYDDSGTFDASEVVYEETTVHASHAGFTGTFNGSFVIPASATTEKYLRIRVLVDRANLIGAVNDGDHTSDIGQTEDYAMFISPVPLKIEMSEFTATIKSSQVNLYWVTKSETNNDYFSIEHSVDGINFITIGKVNGAGNSTGELNYQFIHSNPTIGINYYRIKDVDFDGKEEFSSIRKVVYKDNELISIYPNPFKNEINIKLADNQSKPVGYSIMDVTGRILQEKQFDSYHKSANITLDLNDLPKGIYYINLNINGTILTKKIVKY
jgi:hypothetical protein